MQGQMTFEQFGPSPIPSPETLAGYNELMPDRANRFMVLVENQSKHRQDSEKFVIQRDAARSDRGLNYAFIVTIAGFVLVGFLAYIGQPVVAGVFGATEIAALASVFIVGRRINIRRLARETDQ